MDQELLATGLSDVAASVSYFKPGLPFAVDYYASHNMCGVETFLQMF
jgi:hypothetical protein